ncbi:MAG: SUMF1/EgtB/PvdO family nonheme iron enzyme [Acidobacteria bacterium]|nr:SUMF1/EgtB/PvdO family nonheme iron enzyme [Acidobacteriota bacterium]
MRKQLWVAILIGLSAVSWVASAADVQDFNGDQLTDIRWRNDESGMLSTWYMGPGGMTGSGFLGGISDLVWKIAGVGDMDGDSICDILWRHASTGSMSVWFARADGTGIKGDMSPGTVDPFWKIVGLGDADGDGKADIFWRHDASGTMSVWYIDETGLKGTGFIGGIGSTDWQVMGVGDFNGDGKSDILWRQLSTGAMSVWFVTEGGFAGDMSPGTVDPSWKIVGLGDADGDQKSDIFWRNEDTGTMSVWFIDETGLKGTAYIGGIDTPTWQVVGIGDFDGDGKSDIFWRHNDTGAMSVWFVTEGGFAGEMSPGGVDPSWKTRNSFTYRAGYLVDSDPIAGNLRFVPSGTFVQGSPTNEPCRYSSCETPFTHTLTKDLAVMETEVTRQMWADLLAVQSTLPADPTDTDYGAGMTNPVQQVTWFEALLFANLLSVQKGLTRCYYADAAFTVPIDADNYTGWLFYCDWDAEGYRLLSEGEWEYVCRAGTAMPFWIAEPNYTSGNCGWLSESGMYPQLETAAWFWGNSSTIYATSPVGTKVANPWDLRDMHGNVYEWCWDLYQQAYPTGLAVDYRGPSSGPYRMFRGGGWRGHAHFCRAAYRGCTNWGLRYDDMGFRLVRVAR